MSIAIVQGAAASTVSSARSVLSPASRFSTSRIFPEPSVLSGGAFNDSSGSGASENRVRHLLFGTLGNVNGEIAHLHTLGYAEPNDWSRPISTGRSNEVMAILTKRVRG